jgi:hypothetical protein
MLTEQEIQQALHASRVAPLATENPHGPIGLEQLAEEVAQLTSTGSAPAGPERVRRSLELPVETWEKLEHLASSAAKATHRPTSAAEVAAAIIERFLASAERD